MLRNALKQIALSHCDAGILVFFFFSSQNPNVDCRTWALVTHLKQLFSGQLQTNGREIRGCGQK